MGIIQGGNKVGGLVMGGKSVVGIVKGGAVVFRKGEGNPDPPVGDLEVKRMADGKLWTVRNLDIDWPGSRYYNDDPAMGQIYGRMYSFVMANDVASSIGGYHVPSQAEWRTLAISVGGYPPDGVGGNAGRALKATYGWGEYGNGGDWYGFTGLPGGVLSIDNYNNEMFNSVGMLGSFWSSTQVLSVAVIRELTMADSLEEPDTASIYNLRSVRLIKDE